MTAYDYFYNPLNAPPFIFQNMIPPFQQNPNMQYQMPTCKIFSRSQQFVNLDNEQHNWNPISTQPALSESTITSNYDDQFLLYDDHQTQNAIIDQFLNFDTTLQEEQTSPIELSKSIGPYIPDSACHIFDMENELPDDEGYDHSMPKSDSSITIAHFETPLKSKRRSSSSRAAERPDPPRLPSYEELISEALHGLGDKHGHPPREIFKWLSNHYCGLLPLQFKGSATQALKKAWRKGRFLRTDRKYRINPDYSAPTVRGRAKPNAPRVFSSEEHYAMHKGSRRTKHSKFNTFNDAFPPPPPPPEDNESRMVRKTLVTGLALQNTSPYPLNNLDANLGLAHPIFDTQVEPQNVGHANNLIFDTQVEPQHVAQATNSIFDTQVEPQHIAQATNSIFDTQVEPQHIAQAANPESMICALESEQMHSDSCDNLLDASLQTLVSPRLSPNTHPCVDNMHAPPIPHQDPYAQPPAHLTDEWMQSIMGSSQPQYSGIPTPPYTSNLAPLMQSSMNLDASLHTRTDVNQWNEPCKWDGLWDSVLSVYENLKTGYLDEAKSVVMNDA